jgi:hypothetical protein
VKLDYFRLVLTEDNQLNFLNLESMHTSRPEAVKMMFKSDFDFKTSRGKEFTYVYKVSEKDYILGLIFEKQNVPILENPRSSMLPEIRDNWTPFTVVINDGTIKGENSQLFLLEHDSAYNQEKRLKLLNDALSDSLNKSLKMKKLPFVAEFHPVLTMQKFEELYGRKDLRELIIEYTMPNFLGIGNELQQTLSRFKNKMNATKVKESITNENGNLILDPEYEDLKQAVESSKLGQSRITIKDYHNTKIYDSNSNETLQSTTIQIASIEIQAQTDVELKATLKEILKELNL